MLCSEVENYIDVAKGLPFFYAVGDDNYIDVLNELKQQGVEVDRVSDFCPRDDKYPDLDDIIDHFRTLDVDCHSNKHVLIGLGEILALRGASYAEKQLRRLKDTTLGTARVILLLRCVTPQVYHLISEDDRLSKQKRVYVSADALSSLSVTRVKYALTPSIPKGVKGLLRVCEDGATGACNVNTVLDFPQSLLPVISINTAFAAIKRNLPGIKFLESFGEDSQWDHLFHDINKCKGSIEKVFENYQYTEPYEDDLFQNCAGFEYRNWLFFLCLKHNAETITNSYLRYVVDTTDNYAELKDNILTGLLRVSRNDIRFKTFYAERKKLIKDFPESELAVFIHESDVDPAEGIYRYTDSTRMECEHIIDWVAKHGYIKEIEWIYPALAQYLKPYIFDCGKHSAEFTDYFQKYRTQKLANSVTPEFLKTVEENAKNLPYTHLETRDSAIMRISDKKNAYLYWIDALGVEYLAYITELVRKKGLSMHVDIAYSELPTITSINKNFYDNWAHPLKHKEEELDDIKHKAKGGFVYTDGSSPIHLYSELKVIERAIDFAATELAMHHCKSFIIASDHGASRLAVIHQQEEKYETDTKGEHSGRCCKEFPDADLPYAIRENGYLVLADYGRFKKSRAANVEVHGGASLEEVLVPVITLTLKKQADQVIKLIGKDAIYSDRHEGTIIKLYISDIEHTSSVSVVIAGTRYQAVCDDVTHYTVVLADIRRAKKKVSAEIYDGDDLVGNIEFEIKGRTGRDKGDFDDLF